MTHGRVPGVVYRHRLENGWVNSDLARAFESRPYRPTVPRLPSFKPRCRKIILLVTGDRHWPLTRRRVIAEVLSGFQAASPYVRVVHGDADGVDRLAAYIAGTFGYATTAYPADWKKHGRPAGPIRNQQMLDEEPDICWVLAFHPNLADSKGTRDMVTKARARGIHTSVYGPNDTVEWPSGRAVFQKSTS